MDRVSPITRETANIKWILRTVFKKDELRPLQREVMIAVIEGHDVFLQASTSFGKSLCYQLPAVLKEWGLTLVICPLLSLMTDQVNHLKSLGVSVATINSSISHEEKQRAMNDMLCGHPSTRLLYVTPESLQTEKFRRQLLIVHKQRQLVRVAIDEAHCISEWGHDFRPAYKELGWLRKNLVNPQIPITAVTATATPNVREDIIRILGLELDDLKLFNTPSDRPNIHYEVRYRPNLGGDFAEAERRQLLNLHNWLRGMRLRREARLGIERSQNPPMSGIVYVGTRAMADQLAIKLSSDETVNAVAYHAGVDANKRSRIQSTWKSSRSFQTAQGKPNPTFSIIVATNAFGMGIDNPDVRFVVHWTPPRSFESFVQESGRAGRDGCAAASLVYYGIQERDSIEHLIWRDAETHRGSNATANRDAKLESFGKVIRYCESIKKCRHELIKEFFGDHELEEMGSQRPVSDDVPVSLSPCDFACDFCKEGQGGLANRRREMASAAEMAQLYADCQ